jgi:hypothetical protein
MTRTWLKRIAVLALCAALSCYWALSSRGNAANVTTQLDFAQMYFGVRCVFAHHDLYDGSAPLRAFEATGWKFPPMPAASRDAVHTLLAVADYPPTTYFVLAPFALPSWPLAQQLWFWLMAGLLVLAALLVWDLASAAPALAGCLAAFMLLNCKVVLMLGNPGGIVVPFCVIAAWCLLRQRFAPAAVVLLAASLMMKPQIAGFVWLYFLLAGGPARKRAWQTLALVGILGVGAAIWILPASPHWIPEVRHNLAAISAHGWFSDAGPGVVENFRSYDPVIGLPGLFSLFANNPRIYDLLSDALAAGLALAWCIAVARKRSTPESALLALAAVSALTLVMVYHRTHDTKLLLLTIPACALHWAGGGARRWVALLLTAAAIFVTSDVPILLRLAATRNLSVSGTTFAGRLTMLALQPAPLVLLAAGCFYLWVYIRYQTPAPAPSQNDAAKTMAPAG